MPEKTMDSRLRPGEHSFATPDNRTLVYSIYTKRDCTTTKDIIVVHSPAWGLGYRYLVHGLEPLQDDYTLVFLHPRGTGGSAIHAPTKSTKTDTNNSKQEVDAEDEDEDMTPFNLAHDLDALRRHLDMPHFPTLLGHSHGGTIALAYAQLFPSQVSTLILVAHRLLRPGENHDKSESRRMAERSKDERYAAACAAFSATPGPRSDAEFTRFIDDMIPLYFYRPELHAAAFRAVISEDVQARQKPMSLQLLRRVQRGSQRSDVREMMQDMLNAVTARTLIIFGREDATCATDNADATKRGIPHAQVEIIEECDHFPFIEKPDETFAAIRQFLGGSVNIEQAGGV